MQFEINYTVNDTNHVQQLLNDLYAYNDLSTKVFHRKRLNLIYETIEKLVRKRKIKTIGSALDIGCNVGFCSKIISDLGFQNVLGIDISEEMIIKANKHFSVNNKSKILSFQCISAENLTKMNKQFDFILCTEVIEHVNEPCKVIENIRSLLSENGLALISLPNKISLNYGALIIGKKITGRPVSEEIEQHLKYPFYKSLKTFRNMGFEVVNTSGTNFFLVDHMLRFVVKFPLILKIDSIISKLFPFKYFSQFFFMTLRIKHGKE